MLLAYEAILLTWLHIYGYLVSRARQSRFGIRVRAILQGVTGVVLLSLGLRLAFEQKK
jgi:threonine/homoserine/homoserine lactone efflux protein